jgi:TolB protein
VHCLKTLVPIVLLAAMAAPAHAQEDKIPTGVRLGFIYQTAYRPKLALRPVEASGIATVLADSVDAILGRDLDYSDRFDMVGTPADLAQGAVDYKAWNDLGVVYLVTAQLQATATGYSLRLALHDVVYATLKQIQAFQLPPAGGEDFRMALHAAGDQVVAWATGQAGSAASRVVYRMSGKDGMSLNVVDSDGANAQRIVAVGGMLFSPVWSPDGERMMYVQEHEGQWQLVERDMAAGKTRVVTESHGLLMTPTYEPDGRHIAYARYDGGGTRIYEYDLAGGCCLKRLTGGPGDDLSPSYSPDGSRLAFNSNRLGAPHIYVMPAAGGDPTLLSPFVYGEAGYYTSPEWSPTSSLVAFHGRSQGVFQVMIADADKPGDTIKQITADGVSEDPSWAPDGRHLVFAGQRDGVQGLYVVDSTTGRVRPLAAGGRYELPEWSPRLMTASALAAGG